MKQYSNYIFVTGMFRSGTTLLSHLLNTHSKIILAADVLLEFVKSYRNEIYLQNNFILKNPTQPLESNYISNNKDVRGKIENSNFNIKYLHTNLLELTDKTRQFAQNNAVDIFVQNLKKLEGTTCSDVLQQILGIVEKSYYKEKATVIGFKSCWCEQYVAPFLNEFSKNGKAIFIIRDPRSLFASSYAIHSSNYRYPFEFLIEQWRKSVTYATLYSNILPQYRNKCLTIRYEDLISSPRKIIKKITDFLNLDFEKKLLDPSEFRDGENKPWIQNTSYGNPKLEYSQQNKDKWRSLFNDETKRFIEMACYPEMRLMGYETDFVDMRNLNSDTKYPKDDPSKFANWIKEFYPDNVVLDNNWIKKTEININNRNSLLLKAKNSKLQNINLQEIENLFIDSRYFEFLIEMINK